MCAALIFFLARVIRWAIVVSGTRNAAAISGTVRPPSRRRVSATRASGARAGWQQVKISRSRSSSTGPVGSWGVSSCDHQGRLVLGVAVRLAADPVDRPLRRPWWSATRRGWAVRRRRATARGRRGAPPRPPPRRRRCRRSGGSGRRRPGRTPRGRSARLLEIGRHCGSAWKGRTSTRPSHAAEPSLAQLQRGVEVGRLDDPEAAEVLLRLRVRPVGDDRLGPGAVDRRGRLDRLEAAGEHPDAGVG